MPKIPLTQFTPSATQSSNVRANTNLLGAEFAGMQQAGKALQGVADVMEKHAIAKETHIAKGQLAGEKMFRDGVDSDISNFATDNPGDATALEEFSKKRWEDYEIKRGTRRSDEGWSNMAVDADDTESAFDKKRSQIAVESAATGMRIEESNKRLGLRADQLIQSGRDEQAAAVIDEMNLSDADKAIAKAEIFAESKKQIVLSELSVAGSMEPAMASQSYKDIIERLSDMEEYTTEHGGLSRADRGAYLDAARKQSIHTTKVMRTNAATLAARIADGAPKSIVLDAVNEGLVDDKTVIGLRSTFIDAIDEAKDSANKERSAVVSRVEQVRGKLARGEITEEKINEYLKLDQFTSEDAAGLRQWAREVKTARKAHTTQALYEDAMATRSRQVARAESIRSGVSRGDISQNQIENYRVLGEITQADADQLTVWSEAVSRGQMMGEEFQTLRDTINAKAYVNHPFFKKWRLWKTEVETSEMEALQLEISKSNFTPELKNVLIGDVLTVLSLDRDDMQQEEKRNYIFDRSFTPEEGHMAQNLYKSYGESDQEPEVIGAMIFKHDRAIRDWFDVRPVFTQQEVDIFQKTLIDEVIGSDTLSILQNQ